MQLPEGFVVKGKEHLVCKLKSQHLWAEAITKDAKHFEIKDMGELTHFLGVKIVQKSQCPGGQTGKCGWVRQHMQRFSWRNSN